MRERIGKVFILQSYDYAVVVTGFLMWKVKQQGVPQALCCPSCSAVGQAPRQDSDGTGALCVWPLGMAGDPL